MDFLSLLKFIAEGKFQNARAISQAHVDFLRKAKSNAAKRSLSREETLSGVYQQSIVWDYFVRGKKKFGELGF